MNRTCSESTVPLPPPDKVLCRFRVSTDFAGVARRRHGDHHHLLQEGRAAATAAAMVQVMEVTATNVPLTAEFIGQLDSPQNVEVRARVEAFVDKMLFTEGTEVKEGDLLFELDEKPFQERLAAANGSAGRGQGGA